MIEQTGTNLAVFVPSQCTLGEGPVWYLGRLWWVDIDELSLLTVDQNGGDRQVFSLPSKIGCFVPINASRFLLALQDGFHLLNTATGETAPWGQSPGTSSDHRFNDGKCDAAGRLIAGTLHMAGAKDSCQLFSVEGNGAVREILSPVTLSNGLAWNADGSCFYYIDSLTRSVQAFDYDLDTGDLLAGRKLFDIAPELGIPDGMDIDRDGNLWVAHWDGWAVRCWSPQGEILREIKVPCARPTSCCFGGPSLNQLFITTVRTGLTPEELAEQPLAGNVFVCTLPQSGYPVRSFRLNE